MPDLHLVDATYELFRAYTAIPSRRGPQDQEVAAVGGLVSILLKLLREPGVTHVACATDHVIESFRNELFDGYKTGEGLPADLWEQFPLAEEAIEALGLTVWKMEEFEADDALATATRRYADDFERILICTPDKDLAQCVIEDRVVLWDRRREIQYDHAGVIEKWGVPPSAIADYLALVGDSADGIPGIPRWGAKSTGSVLSEYGSLEAIPADPSEWSVKVRGAKTLAQNLAAQREDAQLYKTLATLRFDVPLTESAADLEWRGAPCGQYQAFCDSIGMERLKDRPHRWLEE